MTRPSPAELDARIRSSEQQAYAAYGVTGTERMVTVDSGAGPVRVRVMEFGAPNDRPTVLLLHGIASASVLAAPLLGFLRDRHVVALDWPGHGLSDPCLLAPSLDLRVHVAAVLRSVLDGLDAAEVDVVGHSLGAQIALYASLDLGPRVRRVVLLGAPGAAFEGVKPVPVMRVLALPKVGPRVLSIPMSDRQFQRNNDLALGAGALRHADPALVATLKLIGARTGNAASIAGFFHALVRWSVRPSVQLDTDALARIRQPVLLVWGDDDVFQRPVAAARSIVSIPDSRLVRIAGAGHAPWLQALDRTGAAIGEHLAA
ncbi:MAG TPA: alpha/beta hydrolase [Aldersonia sp.]